MLNRKWFLVIALFFGAFSAHAVIKQDTSGSDSDASPAQALLQALNDARALAEESQFNVVLCRADLNKGEIEACEDGDDWSVGWIMYVDHFPIGDFDPDKDQLVKSSSPGSTASVEIIGLNHRIRFNIDGTLLAQGIQSLEVCEQLSNNGYKIMVPITGKAKSEAVNGCSF